jgi:hypothetical protein
VPLLACGVGVACLWVGPVFAAPPSPDGSRTAPGLISPYEDDVFVSRSIPLPSGERAIVMPAYRGFDDSADADEPSLALVIAVLDHTGAMVLERVALSEDLGPDLLPPSGETPYARQSLIIQDADFNFDGRPDLMVNQGPLGCYGDSMYRYYLSTPDDRYRNHPGLDRLADMHCRITPDVETGLIMAVDGREGASILSTWYRCDGAECEKVRERIQR